MTGNAPLDLRGVAKFLKVRFYRVRRWRDNFIHGRTGPNSTVLCAPDVSDLDRNPLWSESAIEEFAKENGLWPPGVDQHRCGYCGEKLSVYPGGLLRPHGWAPDEQGKLWPCEGSYTSPKERARERTRA